MDRRDSIKAMLIGTIGGAALVTSSCKQDELNEVLPEEIQKFYGRTQSEIEHDKKINAAIYLNNNEIETIAILCDIILPATSSAGSATDAGVPNFIDFIVKDIPSHQLPIRGGIMWLDNHTNERFDLSFKNADHNQQLEIIEDIAYPNKIGNKPQMSQGIAFFDLMRKLTLTGYYTSKIGFDDLGYKGNTPNIWDGVPQDVLNKHKLEYDDDWLAKCVNQEQRAITAKWDDNMNLIS